MLKKTIELEKILALAHEYKEQLITGQMGLFGGAKKADPNAAPERYAFAPLEDWATKVKLEKEKEVAGFYLTSHPLKSYKVVSWLNYTSYNKAMKLLENVKSLKEPVVTCIGLLQSKRVITTKKGDKMAFAQMEDLSGHADIIIFPRVYQKVKEYLDRYNVFLIKGNLDITSERICKIKANQLLPMELVLQDAQAIQEIILKIPASIEEKTVEDIAASLPKGSTPLLFAFTENNESLIIQSRSKIGFSQEILENIEQNNIKIELKV